MLDRPFIGYLDGKKVQVNSYDIIEKIEKGNLESNYKFEIETTKETEREIYNNVNNKNGICFKTNLNGVTIKFKLDLKYLSSVDLKLKDNYIISIFEIISLKKCKLFKKIPVFFLYLN